LLKSQLVARLSTALCDLKPSCSSRWRAFPHGATFNRRCSQYALVEENQDMTHADNLVYSIDIRKHKSCYALFAASADTSNARIRWAVVDEERLIDGPFLAIAISENSDDTNDNIPLVVSYNILVLKQLGTREYRRVGEGEVSGIGYLADESLQSLRIT